MKKTDFNPNKDLVRYLDEISKPKKKRVLGKYLYLGVLSMIFMYSAHYVYRKLAFVEGEGQVLFKKLEIQMPADIKIEHVLKEEGSPVEKGDTLFTFYSESDMIQSPEIASMKTINNDQLNWYHREKISSENKASILKIKRDELQQEKKLLEEEIEKVTNNILLDLNTVGDLNILKVKLEKTKRLITSTSEEILYYNNYRSDLKIPNPYQVKAPVTTYKKPALQAYIAPVAGTITKINKEDYEVALESEIIMSIHKPTNLYIKAFYPQEKLKHLKEGDLVNVEFPDGTSSKGKLERFYFATYKLPQEFQKKYEPLTRSIAADILPLNEEEKSKWEAFYKLNVNIVKKKI